MELVVRPVLTWICVLAVPAIVVFLKLKNKRRLHLPLPPGPFPWPIVGSLFSYRMPLYEYYGELADKYGPVFMLKVGTINSVVLSSVNGVDELLKLRDSEFAYKPHISILEYISFGHNDIASASDDSLKKLKRICSAHLFSNARMNMLAQGRKTEMQRHIHTMFKSSRQDKHTNLTSLLHDLTCNITQVTVLGKPHCNSETALLERMVYTMESEYTRLSIGDLWPFLHRLDLQGKRRKWAKEIIPPFKEFLVKKVREHRARRVSLEEATCFLDVLLSLQGKDQLSDINILGVLSNMIGGGMSTQEATLCWIFAELLSRPDVMRKAQEEIDNVVGKDRLVDEADLPKLPYITAIVKEAMRLHYTLPIAAPHYNPEESELLGYRIPAKTSVLINFWAILHDPTLWEQPNTFIPERFMEPNSPGFVGNSTFLPFGTGRRICPGFPLTIRFVPLVTAALVQAFEFSISPGHEILEYKSKFQGINNLATDLLVTLTPRLSDHLYINT